MQERLYKYLKQRLRLLRLSSGLTQEEMAEKANISYKYYQAIEEGRKKDLRISTLSKLAEAHSLNLSKLLDMQAHVPAEKARPGKATSVHYKKTRSGKPIKPVKKVSKHSSR